MYKVFYNEKVIILTDSPLKNMKSFKFNVESVFDEVLYLLRHSSTMELNIYYHNLAKLWNSFKTHFDSLEAAGGLVFNQKKEILFIHRLGKWDLPKGKVEKGETPEIAALREVEEECGVKNLKLNEFLTTTYHIYYQNGLKFKTTYWYKMTSCENEILIPQTEEGIDLVVWKSKEEIEKIVAETYENIKIVLHTFGLNQLV
ncbi:MAG: NUDIX domain-containing protein [Weeksellaceae bacterium]|jgi:8-oxo-dGTP pyrophosphatase MutT (NUDIX family)|nr:NUDIX domain-containing protein [Weeksellaceae bacterium]MDX9705765.1 NUDIX domain-containing protein [Weeksellaceae bacterium]